MNTRLYTAVAAALAAHQASPALVADIDTIFHSPEDAQSPPAPKTMTYNAANYAQRGDGYQDWLAAGRPAYDVEGRQLDSAGWPVDGPAGEPNTDLVGGVAWVTLQTPIDAKEVTGNVPTAGAYWLQASEQPDQNWVLQQDRIVGSGNGSSNESDPFQLEAGPVVLSCSFNPAAVSPEVLAERVAAGQGISKMHYTLRPA